MKIHLISFYALCCGAMLWSGAMPAAHAEGSQSYSSFGVNRVVRSKDGHQDVSGTASASFSQPINSQGEVDANINPFDNKATAYLGGTAQSVTTTPTTRLQYRRLTTDPWTDIPSNQAIEVDGGLQFETPVRNGAPLGWAAFIVYNRNQVSPSVWRVGADGVEHSLPWRGGSYSENGLEMTGGISSAMSFHIGNTAGDQGMRVDIGAMNGSFYFGQGYDSNVLGNVDRTSLEANATHPIAPWQPYAINNTNQANANVKRVSGMTRSTMPARHSELDGSQVVVTWSGCSVDGHTWTKELTNQNATGYDAPGANAPNDTHLDRRINRNRTALSSYIVAFPSLDDVQARAPLTNEQVAAGTPVYAPQRYASETVGINLRMAAQPTGQALEWAAP